MPHRSSATVTIRFGESRDVSPEAQPNEVTVRLNSIAAWFISHPSPLPISSLNFFHVSHLYARFPPLPFFFPASSLFISDSMPSSLPFFFISCPLSSLPFNTLCLRVDCKPSLSQFQAPSTFLPVCPPLVTPSLILLSVLVLLQITFSSSL